MESRVGWPAAVVVLLSLVLLAAAPPVSAATATLEPGVPFQKTTEADSMAYINYSWTVAPLDITIHFVVTGPGGDTLVDAAASSYDSFILALDSGTYTFRWTNMNSTAATLTYSIVSQSTGIDEDIFDTVFLGLLVGAVVVVIIIVLVIVVVMRGGTRTRPPRSGPPSRLAPPGEAPAPFVPGMCPRCGSPFDSQHVFCPKCGHRVR